MCFSPEAVQELKKILQDPSSPKCALLLPGLAAACALCRSGQLGSKLFSPVYVLHAFADWCRYVLLTTLRKLDCFRCEGARAARVRQTHAPAIAVMVAAAGLAP